MDFNCENCIVKSSTNDFFSESYPSIIISIIDEFNGLVYGKYCNYSCAQNDLNLYFQEASDGSIASSVQFKEASQIQQTDPLSQAISEAINTDVKKKESSSDFLFSLSDPPSIDFEKFNESNFLPKNILEHWYTVDALWVDLKENYLKLQQCALILSWVISVKEKDNFEPIPIIVKDNPWVSTKNSWSTKRKIKDEVIDFIVSYDGDTFSIVEKSSSLGTSIQEVKEENIQFKPLISSDAS